MKNILEFVILIFICLKKINGLKILYFDLMKMVMLLLMPKIKLKTSLC